MYIIVPIPRLILDNMIILDDVVLCPMLELDNKEHELFGNLKYRETFTKNKNLKEIFSNSYAIYKSYNDEKNITAESIDEMIDPIDLALDCLRVNFTSFKMHEQIIGTPGLFKGKKTIVIFNDDLMFNRIVTGSTIFYSLSEGIGCDAQGISIDEKTKDMLLSSRNDDVYLKYRRILHRTCKSMEIFNVDNCFSFLCSTIESLINIESYGFTKKKIAILSFIATEQKEFDILSQKFYFYSKLIRTEVVHFGKSLLNFFPWKEVYDILNDLFLLIIRFCESVIDSNIYTFDELNAEILKKTTQFTYNIPNSDTEINTISVLDDNTCDYYAEVSNLYIKKCLKIGDTIFIPACSETNINKFRELYNYGMKISLHKNLEEKDIKITSDFPNYNLFDKFNIGERAFTLWDVDIIFTSLFYIKAANLDTNIAFAILTNQSYWLKDDEKFDFNYSAQFADIICNTIQKAFSYPILLMKNLNTEILPSKVGLNNEGIRYGMVIPPKSNSIYYIPGRVYREYQEPSQKYTPQMNKGSYVLYKCLYDNRKDEVYITNQNALHHLAECIYINNLDEKLISIFNILEMLHPQTIDGKKLIKHISAFVCTSNEERIEFIKYQQYLRDELRNPIIHCGKSIKDLPISHSDIILIINEIKKIIIKYCENVYSLSITTFEDLKEEQTRRVQNMQRDCIP